MERSLPVVQICTFNDIVHRVQVHVESSVLLIKVEDELTTEAWNGSFTAQYVEELAQKAGNYKSFRTFVDMLCKALVATTASLELHWLTQSDLQALYAKRQHTFHPINSVTAIERRYLILTYNAEYDRVHFPLPLNSTGPPDTAILTAKLRELAARPATVGSSAIDNLTEQSLQSVPDEITLAKVEKLQSQLEQSQQQVSALLKSKHQLEGQIAALKQQNLNLLADQSKFDLPGLDTLKDMILSLEKDLTEQKNKFYRSSQAKADRIDKLQAELEAVKASERHLQAKCRHLTTELSKRTQRHTTSTTSSREPEAARAIRTRYTSPRSRDTSSRTRRSPKPDANATPSYMRPTRSSRSRSHSQTRPRRQTSAGRGRSRSTSAARGRPTSSTRARSASPSQRFDPTAYVKQRQEKIQAAKARREAGLRRRQSMSSRNSSNRSSRQASPSPLRRHGGHSRGRSPAIHLIEQTSESRPRDASTGGTMSPQMSPARPTATQPRPTDVQFKGSSDIADIDARLNALQAYLEDAKRRQ
eukprot:TRINITY_DN6035_c0_g1_i1.p1 TRINITY_DN6035_c0_g1~~TRINITY_DN6035_c0_g1_i1.p1  ORF type:complete len:531 (+),score=52.28 TRINITY_DN6035_c0_g1_i1:70-1662(+)